MFRKLIGLFSVALLFAFEVLGGVILAAVFITGVLVLMFGAAFMKYTEFAYDYLAACRKEFLNYIKEKRS